MEKVTIRFAVQSISDTLSTIRIMIELEKYLRRAKKIMIPKQNDYVVSTKNGYNIKYNFF